MAKKQRDALPPIIPSEYTARPGPGFVQIPALCLSLPGNAIKVWMAARNSYNPKKRHSWQSHETMAAELKMSKSSVKRAVSLLVDEGWMVSVGQKYPGKGHTRSLIALTKPATPEEIRSWTREHQSAQLERVHFGSQKSSNLTPKEFISENKRVQIEPRTTSIEQHLDNQHLAATSMETAAGGMVETETDQERVATKELLNPLSLTTNLSEPQSSAAGEGSSLVDLEASPGATGRGILMPPESYATWDRLKGGQA